MPIYRDISLLATGILVKAGVARISFIDIHNNAAAARFVKFYDNVTAPTVGTDVPVMTIQVGAGQHVSYPTGGLDGAGSLLFQFGIGVGATNLVADADTTAPTANDLIINFIYTPS